MSATPMTGLVAVKMGILSALQSDEPLSKVKVTYSPPRASLDSRESIFFGRSRGPDYTVAGMNGPVATNHDENGDFDVVITVVKPGVTEQVTELRACEILRRVIRVISANKRIGTDVTNGIAVQSVSCGAGSTVMSGSRPKSGSVTQIVLPVHYSARLNGA